MARLLAMREREGLTFVELSEETGVPASTLAWWSSRLRRERESGQTLVPVDVVDEKASGDSGVEVEVADGAVIRLARGFDAGTLTRAIEVLSQRC